MLLYSFCEASYCGVKNSTKEENAKIPNKISANRNSPVYKNGFVP